MEKGLFYDLYLTLELGNQKWPKSDISTGILSQTQAVTVVMQSREKINPSQEVFLLSHLQGVVSGKLHVQVVLVI